MSLKSAFLICNYLLAGLALACLVLSKIYSPLSGLIFSVGIVLCISRRIEMLRDTPTGQEFKGQISLAQHDNTGPFCHSERLHCHSERSEESRCLSCPAGVLGLCKALITKGLTGHPACEIIG